jgi:hypothetical protein
MVTPFATAVPGATAYGGHAAEPAGKRRDISTFTSRHACALEVVVSMHGRQQRGLHEEITTSNTRTLHSPL